jgi:20S proteasome subunit alpha 6
MPSINLPYILAGSLEDLIRHGLHALRETLQQDKELTINNTSIGIVGPASTHERAVPAEGPFRILEGNKIDIFLKSMVPKTADMPEPLPVAPATTSEEDVQMSE